MKIVIEGMDGVGKSTIAKKLAAKLNYEYYSSPLASLLCYDDQHSDLFLKHLNYNVFIEKNSKLLKAWCTGLGNIVCMEQSNQNAVIDRYIGSNYVWNFSEETKAMFDLLDECLPHPSYTFILYATPDERRKRIKARNQNDFDLSDDSVFEDLYPKLIEFMNHYGYNYYVIDTTNKDANLVLQEILDLLKGVC